MIEIMSIIALVVGILIGLWSFGGNRLSWLFTIYNSTVFRTEKAFYDLYDMADDEVSFKWYIGHNSNVKKYADYLRLHAESRSSAYITFKETNDALVKTLAFRILPIALVPAILFWANWYFYVLGVVAALMYLVVYEIAKKGIRPGYYQRLVIYTTLSTHSKNKTKAKSS